MPKFKLLFTTVSGKRGDIIEISHADAERMGHLVVPVPAESAPVEVADQGSDGNGQTPEIEDTDGGITADEALAAYAVGGNWYEFTLKDGEVVRKRGKKAALEFLTGEYQN